MISVRVGRDVPLSERGRELQTVSARLMASSSEDVGSEKERFEVQPLAHARHQHTHAHQGEMSAHVAGGARVCAVAG